MATVDVTVMGAGVFGLSVAYACVKRGAKVQVIDPNGVAAGASGGIVGALAPHVPENWNAKKQFQFESLTMSEAFWSEVAKTSGMDVGYAKSGRLQPLSDDRAVALARSREETSNELWQGKAVWKVIQTSEADWEPPSETGLLVRDTLSALIHPRKATLALAKAFEAARGNIGHSGDACGKTVWATGWHGLKSLSEHAQRSVGNGVKGQAALLRFDAAGAPQLFADALHIIPHLDGTVAIGSTSEREFENPDQTDAQIDNLISRAIDAMPTLKDAPVIETWAGVRPRSRSRAPMLGKHPYLSGAYIANGGFKIGFGMAPKVGEVMADLILDDRVTYPADFDVAASL